MICLLFSRIPKIHPHLLGLKLVMNVVNENAVKRLSKSLTNLNKKLPCVSYFFLFLTNQVLLINILFFVQGTLIAVVLLPWIHSKHSSSLEL